MSNCTHHAACQAQLLQYAEDVCQRRGARLTALRRRVLHMIGASHSAVKAYELIARLSTEDHQVKPPTVYRTLDFLLAQGLIHRVDSLNAFVSCSHPQVSHEARLLICDACGTILELDDDAMDHAMQHAIAATGFKPARTHLEIHGLCARCQTTS